MNGVLRERLNTLYAALRLGELDFVLNALDDNIEFISYAPVKVFPFLGHHRGKAAVSKALSSARLAFEFISCEPVLMVIEPDHAAAVMLYAQAVSRRSGRSFRGVLAHFIRFRDGKIVEVREFMDSFGAAEQALGYKLVAEEK